MNVRIQWLGLIAALLSPVLWANETDVASGDRTAVQKSPLSDAGEADKITVTDDAAPQDTVDPLAKKSDENGADKPIFSANEEFKPSEQVSEDLSIPFPVDI